VLRAQGKASNALAGQLRQHILSGDLAEGSALPTERELCAQSGLSRASVREALRMLESDGLIETRPGRNGGTRIKEPTPQSIARSIGLYVRGSRVRLEALLETREAIEPAVARLAALNRTETDIARLTEAHARLQSSMDDRFVFLKANLDWHLAIALASRNEPLIGFMTAIADVIHAATKDDPFDSDDVRRETIAAHDRILAAIVVGDTDAAQRRMARHVGAYCAAARQARVERSEGHE
jgi:DNA-binding FadR family transcriptional regulator